MDNQPHDDDAFTPIMSALEDDGDSNKFDALLESTVRMTAEARMLRHSVADLEASARRDKKMIRLLSSLVGMIMLGTIGIGFTAYQNYQNGNVVADCIKPSGECYKRQGAVNTELTQTFSVRSELERISTELPVALAKEDQVRISELTTRKAQLEQRLQESATKLEQLRAGAQQESKE